MLGEIRDAATASLAIQAALSGHRLISTLHAGTPGGAISRLLEMGLEPYQLVASLYGIAALRLVRRRTETGYKGRIPMAEFGVVDPAVHAAIMERQSSEALAAAFARQPGFASFRQTAESLVAANITDAAEIQRVLGL
jgi:type II secretory ATPase GspE/PulE/Tfp pilus assembly ATPase PilB-like protein